MAITIDGTGSISGISAGGIPDGCVDTDVLANNAVTYAKIGTTEQGQLCKAWVNFNGTSTVAIRASYNVSSITDNATGTYSVNFTTAMPDANYCGVITSGFASGVREDVFGFAYSDAPYAPASGAYGIKFVRADTNVAVDPNHAMVAIFR